MAMTFPGGGKTLVLARAGATASWQAKQAHSVGEYKVTQEAGVVPDEVAQLYRLFRSYLVAALPARDAAVLDVGCGMGRARPPYAEGIEGYVGLDPIEANLERDYPFVCGRLEDLAEAGQCRGQFDAFAFCTSLDHIEDLDKAAAAVRALARPGARAVFWVGLHDAELVAPAVGAALFRKAAPRNALAAYALIAGYALLRLPRTLWRLAERRRRLREGRPLDDLHFWYFTRESLPGALAKFGRLEELVPIPNTSSVFARCLVQ